MKTGVVAAAVGTPRGPRAASALILLAWVLSGCGSHAPPAGAPDPIPVRVQEVRGDMRPAGQRFSATVEPGARVKLTFNSPGYVESLCRVPDPEGGSRAIQAGDRVRAGEVLARLRRREHGSRVTQARAQARKAQAGAAEAAAAVDGAVAHRRLVEQQRAEAVATLQRLKAMEQEARSACDSSRSVTREAEAQARLAEMELERAQKLFEVEGLTKPDFDKAGAHVEVVRQKLRQARESERQVEAKWRQAQAEVAAGQARVGQATAQISVAESQIARSQASLEGVRADADNALAALDQASLSLDDAGLKAPFTGTVLSRQVEVGAQVSPGAPAFELADLASVRVVFGVPDVDVKRLRISQEVRVLSEALPDKVLPGKITAISPEADPQSRVYRVEVKVANLQGLLKVGMIATLDLESKETPASRLTIPLTALSRTKGSKEYRVFVIEGDLARLRPIQVGDSLEDQIVVAEGLRAGDKVVIEGVNLLSDGDKVRVVGAAR